MEKPIGPTVGRTIVTPTDYRRPIIPKKNIKFVVVAD
jgi:hypothetical protein